jgi:hypothetical protein
MTTQGGPACSGRHAATARARRLGGPGIARPGKTPARRAASQSGRATPRPLLDANRADCEAIRGTDYLSDEERAWFLAYCVGVVVYAPVVVASPVPDVFLLPPVAQRPSEPGVSVTCRSSLGSATAAGDLQNVPLSAIAGEPIYCSASVFGSYTSIDWAGGFTNGSGVNFVTSFDYRRTP